jgi:hypothetical protein
MVAHISEVDRLQLLRAESTHLPRKMNFWVFSELFKKLHPFLAIPWNHGLPAKVSWMPIVGEGRHSRFRRITQPEFQSWYKIELRPPTDRECFDRMLTLKGEEL